MAFTFGAHSVAQRATLHPHLQNILDRVIELHDFRIHEGARTPEAQQAARDAGTSQKRGDEPYPHRIREDGRSWAADLYPFVNGNMLVLQKVGVEVAESAKFSRFIGMVEAEARDYFRTVLIQTGESWRLRSGINWDRDEEILTDQKFQDWPHVEIERV